RFGPTEAGWPLSMPPPTAGPPRKSERRSSRALRRAVSRHRSKSPTSSSFLPATAPETPPDPTTASTAATSLPFEQDVRANPQLAHFGIVVHHSSFFTGNRDSGSVFGRVDRRG